MGTLESMIPPEHYQSLAAAGWRSLGGELYLHRQPGSWGIIPAGSCSYRVIECQNHRTRTVFLDADWPEVWVWINVMGLV